MVARQRSPTVNISQIKMMDSPELEEIDGITIIEENDSKEIEMVPWINTHDMRPRMLTDLTATRDPFRPTCSFYHFKTRTMTSAAKSLDLLRQNLQAAINKEIDLVIKKYLEKFFQPAVRNIRDNLGPGSVTEELIKDVCRAMLDEAKQMYCTITVQDKSTSPPPSPSPLPSEEETEEEMSPEEVILEECLTSDDEMEQQNRDYPPFIKWDPSRVNEETLFILSTTADKILGLCSFKERLSEIHPDLVKYGIDQDDREWLASAAVPGLIQGTPSIDLLLLEDIIQLSSFEEYRDNAIQYLDELQGFSLPDFIQRKVRAYMTLMRTKYIEPDSLPPSPPAQSTKKTKSRSTKSTGTITTEELTVTYDETYYLSSTSTTIESVSSNSFQEAALAELNCINPADILPSFIRIEQPIQMSVGVECLSPLATSLSSIDTVITR